MSGFSPVTYALAKKYTKDAIADITKDGFRGVSVSFVKELPDIAQAKEKVIYFVPSSTDPNDYNYDQYMFNEGHWVKIGTTELHLEDYYTKNEIAELFYNKTEVEENYYTKEEIKNELVNILPTASKETLGAVKIDMETITIDENGVIKATAQAPTAISNDDIDKLFN